ncbi:uncharacterized protein LOC130696547 [Daphnia carinata]|uniref:uncharacterized protein LOC130696547 n=1 Tax=Daphnia carinata TaxID=120202 RepID=UPI00257D76B1|nr:uncharacterized protein LOC130696547 [Daphnia carinata]
MSQHCLRRRAYAGKAAGIRYMLFVLIVSIWAVSFTWAGSTESKQHNMSVTDQPVTVSPTLNTSLATEYNTDYYRNNNRQATRRPATRRPATRRPATRRPVTRRPAGNSRPPQAKPTIGWDHADTCGGNILVPLSEDQTNGLIEETYQSTGFPVARTYPLICTWNVKVSKNCRHARIVLRIDERSRLADDKECNKGFFRVLPFMKEAKICGRVGDVPPLQWHVENQNPEVVTITMRNAGLEDDKSAGFSFSLQGECLPYQSNVTTNGSMNTNSLWLHQIWKDSAAMGGPTVVVPGVNLANVIPWMETDLNDLVNSNTVKSTNSSGFPISGSLPPTSTLPTVTGVADVSNNLNRPPTRRPSSNAIRTRPTRRPNLRRSTTTVRPITTRPTTARPISWDQYDTCGGVINVPLLFDRLSFYESSQFLNGRSFPLVCTWNVKVNPLCRRARVTMRVDVRSRLADVDGCTKGYYTVSPFMKEARICGRIGTVPPYQWYVDDQKPEEVTVFMESVGLGDHRSEGLSFSLQSECIPIRSDVKKIDVDIENYWSNSRWMNRLSEEYGKGDGPRVVIPGTFVSTVSPLPDKNFIGTRVPSMDPENQSEIPWLILKSPDRNQSMSTVSLYTDDSNHILESPSNSGSYVNPTPVSVILQSSNANKEVFTAKPIAATPIVPLDNENIPWLILKSPNETQSTTVIYPLVTHPPLITWRPTSQSTFTTPSVTVGTSIHPTTLPSTTSRVPTKTPTTFKASITTTTMKSTTRSPSNSTSPQSTIIRPPTHQSFDTVHSSTTKRPSTTTSTYTSSSSSTTKNPSNPSTTKSPSITKNPTLKNPSTSKSPSSTKNPSTTKSPSTTKNPSTTAKRPSTIAKRPTTVRPSTKSSTTTRPPSTTKSSTTTRPPSTTKSHTSTLNENSKASPANINSDDGIQEAISYLSSVLEETKKRNNLPSSEK